MRKNILTVLLVACSLLSGCDKHIKHDIKDYQVNLEYKENFKIQVLTDIHWSTLTDIEEQEIYLRHNILEADADLIVIDGDSFFEATRPQVRTLFDFIDSFGKKWVYLKGNHDHQGRFSPAYLKKYLSSKKNVINVDYDDDLPGDANFYVDLKNGDDLVYRLFMLDTGSYIRDGLFSYTYSKLDDKQLDHIQEIQNKETDNDHQTLAFFHIPVAEYQDAYDGYKEGKYVGKGENREKSCPCELPNDNFARLKEAKVQATFCGHDHINSSSIIYEDVIFTYCVKSTDQIYCDEDMIGYTLITLNNSPFGLDNIQPVFHNFKETVKENR